MTRRKRIEFSGRSFEDLRAFPASVRRDAGFQLNRVQTGREPSDWKPMPTIGKGACEIRIRDGTGAFRIIYVAKFDDAIHVLHCFVKKSQQTSKSDIDLAEGRYRQLLKGLEQ